MKNKMIEHVIPNGMQIPNEIESLYQFIEENQLYEGINGCRYGFLFSEDELQQRLCVFAQTGGEGSEEAFWLTDEGG